MLLRLCRAGEGANRNRRVSVSRGGVGVRSEHRIALLVLSTLRVLVRLAASVSEMAKAFLPPLQFTWLGTRGGPQRCAGGSFDEGAGPILEVLRGRQPGSFFWQQAAEPLSRGLSVLCRRLGLRACQTRAGRHKAQSSPSIACPTCSSPRARLLRALLEPCREPPQHHHAAMSQLRVV
jgi:hypothetical protein